jgi:hypothetical protein
MHTQLELPASPEALPLIQAHARALAALVGFDAKRTAAIELACEEAFGLILERVSGASASPWPTPSVSAPMSGWVPAPAGSTWGWWAAPSN